MSWSVLLVDDNARIRKAVRHLFEREPKFIVVAEAEHGREAIEKALLHGPHLIILDFAMPIMNGMEAAPHLLRNHPTVFIIMLTLFGDAVLEASAREVGIHACVSKNHAATHLIPTVHALFDPRRPFPKNHFAAA